MKNTLRSLWFWLGLVMVGIVAAVPARAQNIRQLTRATSTTGLQDSALALVSDSAQRTRAASIAQLRKALGFVAFDSLRNLTALLTADSSTRVATTEYVRKVAATLGVTYPLVAPNGTAAAPSYSFVNSTGLGLYRFGADTLGIALAGANAFQIPAAGKLVGPAGNTIITAGTGNSRTLTLQTTNSSGVAKNVLVLGADSTTTALGSARAPAFQVSGTDAASTPGLTWQSNNNLGLYRVGADTLGIATGGNRSMIISGSSTPTWAGSAGGSLTILAGAGNSRTLTLKTTTSTGAAKSVVVLGADSTLTILGQLQHSSAELQLASGGQSKCVQIRPTDAAFTPTTRAVFCNTADTISNGNLTVSGGAIRPVAGNAAAPGFAFVNGLNSGFRLGDNGSTDTLVTVVNGANVRLNNGTIDSSNTRTIISGDTIRATSKLVLTGLTTEPSTQSALCINNGGGQVYINAAATCTVSSRRFKHDIAPLGASFAAKSVMALRPVSFTYNVGGAKALGLIAEDADSVDHRLAVRDPQGRVNSVNYEQVTALMLKLMQQQQFALDSLRAQVAALRKTKP